MKQASDFPASMGKVAPRELIQNGIRNLDQAAKYTEAELLDIHGVGPKAVRIIQEELARDGRSLRGE
jgi:predicted flap endonuclease-1-like 5' DNA nuclease